MSITVFLLFINADYKDFDHAELCSAYRIRIPKIYYRHVRRIYATRLSPNTLKSNQHKF